MLNVRMHVCWSMCSTCLSINLQLIRKTLNVLKRSLKWFDWFGFRVLHHVVTQHKIKFVYRTEDVQTAGQI